MLTLVCVVENRIFQNPPELYGNFRQFLKFVFWTLGGAGFRLSVSIISVMIGCI